MAKAQQHKLNFSKLSFPEKKWAFTHIFISHKALHLSLKAKQKANEILHDPRLDGDGNGGQVDAFRHAYWMALLCKHIHWRKALKLGEAHEKANYIDFKKKRNEDGNLPDSVSCLMDLLNNKVGIEIGLANLNASEQELTDIIIQFIINGKLFIIYKDSNGNSLDCNGNIIQTNQYIGQWNNKRCIVPSNKY